MLQLAMLNKDGEVKYFPPEKLAYHIDLLTNQKVISSHLKVLI